ncbi:MAG: 30S ribosomal protein S8 [Candidatus Magasanikbacteria bacterium CG11_big_fil_rev_8_21_14_0_20_39_34]|uniref:Small ribosomal subunit protein uS8 n=1 Tax=Candidatus Magasanikbacteria bacterium CG11_big_fil_rev_8_21_14_0_20_39_34 TaxID=1974653 RepID=A0A2H0N3T6_9BACT|nr:MAG: 30S ribosomal protein S8 [Candidatus Magasanikbacteria bacterium CG11_big_fil_rev_8_21_14_0_20_39_34]
MFSDPIADMLTRIRNAQMARKPFVDVPYSKFKKTIVDILEREGYVGQVRFEEKKDGVCDMLNITLKYQSGKPAIQFIKRESKPGHRKYTKSEEIPKVLNGFGLAILSTSKGIMTNKDAREQGIGGEIICSVY